MPHCSHVFATFPPFDIQVVNCNPVFASVAQLVLNAIDALNLLTPLLGAGGRVTPVTLLDLS